MVDVAAFDAVRIPPGMMPCVEVGPEGLELLASGAQNTDNKDAELVQGWCAD